MRKLLLALALALLATPAVAGDTRSACAAWARFWLISEEQYEAAKVAQRPPQMDSSARQLPDSSASETFRLVDARPHQIPAAIVSYATQPGATPQPVSVDADGWPLADLDVKPRICAGSQRQPKGDAMPPQPKHPVDPPKKPQPEPEPKG